MTGDINNTRTLTNRQRWHDDKKKQFGRSGASKFGSIQTTVFCPNFAPPLAEMLFSVHKQIYFQIIRQVQIRIREIALECGSAMHTGLDEDDKEKQRQQGR